MKPIDIEHEVLLALRNAPGRTIQLISRAITTAHGEGPGWRPVANAVMRMECRGWVCVVSEEEVNNIWHPGYGLTPAGQEMASRVHAQRTNARGAEVSV
ncbi:hypothetical protein [Halomonas elongata]|uniref:hypothetical protein n=1 Tax=Halomonas elongata TaxID=2746 RepID=UPI00186B9B26|nr:hypothetical protein [Halomonas elongata]MBW5802025.1 hypothetical protein [Halomonas elongata]